MWACGGSLLCKPAARLEKQTKPLETVPFVWLLPGFAYCTSARGHVANRRPFASPGTSGQKSSRALEPDS